MFPCFPFPFYSTSFPTRARVLRLFRHNTEHQRVTRFLPPSPCEGENTIYLLAVPRRSSLFRGKTRPEFSSIQLPRVTYRANSFEEDSLTFLRNLRSFRNRPAKLRLYHFFATMLYDQKKNRYFANCIVLVNFELSK